MARGDFRMRPVRKWKTPASIGPRRRWRQLRVTEPRGTPRVFFFHLHMFYFWKFLVALSSFFKGFDYGLFSLASTAGADSLRHVVRAVAGRRPGRTPLRRAALVLAGARASLPTSSKKKNSLEKFTETCSRFIRKPNVTEPNRKKSPNSFPLFSMNSVFNDWKQSSRFRVKKLYFSIEFDDEKSKLNIQCVSLGIQNHWFHTIVCIAWINCWGKKSDIKCCSNRE